MGLVLVVSRHLGAYRGVVSVAPPPCWLQESGHDGREHITPAADHQPRHPVYRWPAATAATAPRPGLALQKRKNRASLTLLQFSLQKLKSRPSLSRPSLQRR